MARYFFHLYNDVVTMDDEGRTFPDLTAARANAVKEARELMLETVAEGRINFSHRIEIADETGAVVGTVMFGEAVTVEG
jgi:putative N-acetylmannosamine-6-phosphate epimerase